MAQPAAARPRQKLSLTKLEFCSFVDTPAQQPATFRLIKRADGEGDELQGTWRIAKIGSGENPLVHGWAFQCTDESGAPYQDLQGDVITDDYVTAAEEWFASGGAVDEMHAGTKTARAAFCYPIDADVISACIGKTAGDATKVSGLMVAVRPTPEQLQKIRDKEWTGFSIAGLGTREPIDKSAACLTCGGSAVKAASAKCPSCGAYGAPDDKGNCPSCGKAMKRAPEPALKAVLSTADKDSLPDSSFLYVEPGGSKDADGKTTPRSLRHFPYRDGSGKIDIAHLRDAIGRIPQSSLPSGLRDKLQVRAEKLLAAQHSKRAPGQLAKATQGGESTVVATSEADGHQHTIDLDDPADGWDDKLTTSYNTAEGADNGHSHGWVFDPATGKVTILADSGHDHTVDAVVPAEVIREALLNENGDRCDGCGKSCEQGCQFCPNCGRSMGREAQVVLISARAPAAISPPTQPTPTVNPQENHMDPKQVAKMLTAALALPESHRQYVAKLSTEEQTAFLGLDAAAREAEVQKAQAADPEVYKTAAGRSIRRSDGPLAAELAKRADEQAVEIAKQAEVIKAEQAARAQVVLEKRVSELIPLIGKSLAERTAIVKAVDSITDEAVRTAAIEALKGANAAFTMLGKSIGTNDGGDGSAIKTPLQAWNDGLSSFAKAKSIENPLDATIPFLKTVDGKALKQALDALRPSAQPS